MLKIVCTVAALRLALKRVAHVITKSSTMPCLEHFVLGASESVTLDGFDLETGIRATLSAQILSPGRVALEHKVIAGMLKGAKKTDAVTIGEESSNRCEVTVGASRTSLVRFAVNDMAPMPRFDDSKARAPATKTKGLATMIARVKHAISDDVTRFNLCGVYLTNDAVGAVVSVATDGHRLTRFTSAAGFPIRKGVILHHEAARAIADLCDDDVEHAVTLNDWQIRVQSEDLQIVSRLVEGTFPDYEQVIPKETDRHIRVNRAAMIDGLKSVARVCPDKRSAIVKLMLNGATILHASDPDKGEARIELPFPISDGKDLAIGFNARYMLEALNAETSDEAFISFSDELSPCRIEGAPRTDLLSVVMPVRI